MMYASATDFFDFFLLACAVATKNWLAAALQVHFGSQEAHVGRAWVGIKDDTFEMLLLMHNMHPFFIDLNHELSS